MPRRCSVCAHPDVEQIHARLAGGDSVAELVRDFDLTPAPLYRHRQLHLVPSLTATIDGGCDGPTLERLNALIREAERIRAVAARSGDLRIGLQAIREEANALELKAKLEGQVPETQVNVVNLTEWPLILNALREHPEARLSVVRALSPQERT